MIEKPQLKLNYRLQNVGNDGIVLLTELNSFWVSGDPFIQLSPFLNGQFTVDEIITKLAGKVSMPEIYFALNVLENQGHIVEANNTLPDRQMAYWHSLGVTATVVQEQLGKWKLEVINLCDLVSNEMIQEGLNEIGIKTHEQGNVRLVIVPDYDMQELEEINAKCIKDKTPWLIVKAVGAITWVGPFFQPDDTACWKCVNQRIQGNRQMQAYIKTLNGHDKTVYTSLGALPSTVKMTLHLAYTELSKWMVLGKTEKLTDALLTFDTVNLITQSHIVVKRPQCKTCGDIKYRNRARKADPIVLKSSPKKFDTEGGHRSLLPNETYNKFIHHVSSITGVVTNLTRLDRYGDDGLIYTYAAGHNFAMMSHRGMFFMMKNLRGRSGGKGMTDIQAKLSGLCEAIERYSGVFRGDEIAIKSTLIQLNGKTIIPESYLLFSDYQYDKREQWNIDNPSDYHKVPLRFPIDREIEWSPVWSLTNQEERYVPTGYCYFGHPDINAYYFSGSDANGNAAGNSLEEAILQGFLELVERDAVAIWWYNRLQMARVDIESFNIKYVNDLIAFYRQNNREIWVIDLTNNMKITTFASISRRTDKKSEDIVMGFGAHLDPKIALIRALTEVNQFMPCVSNEDEQGQTAYWYDDPEAIHWWKTATIESEKYLLPNPIMPTRIASDFINLSKDDMKDDVELCVELAKANGMETFVLDQTRPDIGLSVVKVMVPGLRHFWKRFAPGRLYDTPVQMGWLEAAIDESKLNPKGIFF